MRRQDAGLVPDDDHDIAFADLDGLLDALAEPARVLGVGLQPVDDDLDGVPLVAFELGGLLDPDHFTVDAYAHEAALGQVAEQRLVRALAVADHGRAKVDLLAGMVAQDLLDHRLGGPRLHGLFAAGAMGDARPREQDPQVVRDLGQGAHGRAAPARDRALVHGDGG